MSTGEGETAAARRVQPKAKSTAKVAARRVPIDKEPNRKKAIPDNPGVIWHRLFDHWDDFVRVGASPEMGTEIGRLYTFGTLTGTQASAGRLYADVVGRYDRYHNPGLKRDVASPVYQRSSRGTDDEIERRGRDGTLKAYEKRARRARKAFNKLDKCIPTEAIRAALDELCLHDRNVPENVLKDLKVILNRIAHAFFGKYQFN